MTRRLLPPALTAAVAAVVLAGCGFVPPMPPAELPTDLVPDLEAPHVGDPGALSPDGVDAAEQMAVRIRNVGCGQLSTGSGFALDERTIVTNRHVVADTDRIQISTYDGREIDAVSVGVTDVADLALLRTTEPLSTVPGLAAVDAAVGDEVTVVGYPQGGQLATSTGTVLGYEQDPIGSDLGVVGRTNAQVDHGSSGSAALGPEGQVVGVVYAMDVWSNSYIVPVSTLHDLVAEDAFEPLASCRDAESAPAEDEPAEPPAEPEEPDQQGTIPGGDGDDGEEAGDEAAAEPGGEPGRVAEDGPASEVDDAPGAGDEAEDTAAAPAAAATAPPSGTARGSRLGR